MCNMLMALVLSGDPLSISTILSHKLLKFVRVSVFEKFGPLFDPLFFLLRSLQHVFFRQPTHHHPQFLQGYFGLIYQRGQGQETANMIDQIGGRSSAGLGLAFYN